MAVDLAGAHAEVAPLVAATPPGAGLAPLPRALVAYAVAACATALDPEAIAAAGEAALAAGADEELLVEVLVMASAVGVHALHEGVIALERARPRAHARPARSSYWERFEAELPGFLDGLATRSGWAHEAFTRFAGAPAEHGRLDRLTRELVYLALDATPTHRYVPGLRFHVENAARLGATRDQLEQALALAATAPPHRGVGRHPVPAQAEAG